MKTLIAYATKTGAAKECAVMLAEKIGDCTLWDLEEGTQNLDDYDLIIVGTGIRAGRAYKPFKEFLEKNNKALLSKRRAFYICGARIKDYPDEINNNISKELRDAAVTIKGFGGKPVLKKAVDQSWMLADEVNAFAQIIKGLS
jgi:menaquinone-dependent protoporphyrinogen oxidase